jgi:hypothetical protein
MLGWRKVPIRCAWVGFDDVFGGFPGLARDLKRSGHDPPIIMRASKGRTTMSRNANFKHSFLAIVGALLVSSITVGAAVGPAQAIAAPVGSALNA